jgi:hypothetical protein
MTPYARVSAGEQPGEVLVSATVEISSQDSEIQFESRGLQELKRVFQSHSSCWR